MEIVSGPGHLGKGQGPKRHWLTGLPCDVIPLISAAVPLVFPEEQVADDSSSQLFFVWKSHSLKAVLPRFLISIVSVENSAVSVSSSFDGWVSVLTISLRLWL